jgi:hypothetical protein
MADQNKNILKSIVVELNHVLKIIASKLQDPEAKKAALLALGLNPAGAAQSPNFPAGSLNSIQQYADKADDDIDIEAFASVVADIISVSNAIDDFIHLVSSDDPEIATEFFDMMLQLYLMDAVRLRSSTKEAKAFYGVIKALDLYEELGTSSGGFFGFTKNIVGFIKKAVDGFDADDEDEAALTSHTIFLALAVLSYIFPFIRDNIKIHYGFDPPPLSGSPNADIISGRTLTLSISLETEDAEGNEITATGIITLAIKPAVHQGKSIEMLMGGGGKLERKFDGWKFSFEMEAAPNVSTKVKLEKDGEYTPLLLGDSKGSHLKIGKPGIELAATLADEDLDIKLNTKDSAFVLAKGKSDGFITSILPEKGIHGNFDFGLGFSLKKGLYVAGGSGISVFIPLHTTIGPLTLNSFFTKLTGNQAGDGVSLETSIGFTTKFFGFTASVERIGLIHDISIPENGSKNLGFMNYGIGFKPPNGVGLALDTGLIKGGGFLYLDAEKGEYFGALELDFKGLFTLKAVGVINTKMPDGSPGFSLLIIITAEFMPIQLSFGFTLNGVGGLLGLHRTAKMDVLREGLKTNTLKSILFPQDVVANMSRIISDIRQVFPPLNDHFLIGPMGKLGWGTPSIITLELCLLLEIPVPRIAILGIFKIVLPEENIALIKLQVNFLGIIDFENSYISFDASLYDSRLLIYTLDGDMAFRLSWGDNPMFIMSVGGFHPAFKDAPGDLLNMSRLSISLLSGNNPRITIQSYYAITSNTVQFGARAELYAAACGFNIYGFIGYDVLFQFDPFKFIAAFNAGLALRKGSSVIMGISVSGQLAGPKPMDAKGEASFSILFFDVTISFHETWGGNEDAIGKQEENLIERLKQEINDNRNWKADIPDINSLYVSIKKIEQPPDKLIIHPFGVLTFSERSVPLEISINRFGIKKPKDDINRFEIKPADAGLSSAPVTEQFAPANFFDLNDSEKLGRPSFEHMKSGFKITGSSVTKIPAMVTKSVDYELTYLRKKRGLLMFAGIYKYAKSLFQTNIKAGSVAKSGLSYYSKKSSSNAPEQLQMVEEGFAVANTSDLKLFSSTATTGSYSEALQLKNEMVRKDPSLKGKIQVVSQYELN